MIMNTAQEEEVNGQVIGEYLFNAALFYDGRIQAKREFAITELGAVNQCRENFKRIKEECGPVFLDIYPKPLWEIRIGIDFGSKSWAEIANEEKVNP